MALSSDFLTLLENHCTTAQIQSLLRRYKQAAAKEEKKDILVSGPNKDAIVRNNLREAVAGGKIPEKAVHELLQEAEENGDQHIFYYRPRSEAKKSCRDPEQIARKLWGKDWKSTSRFPRFILKPQDYTWVDFRIGSRKDKPGDWIAKIYGHDTYRKKIDEKRVGADEVVERYKILDERAVCVIRWNSPDILEIRVPTARSRGYIRRRLDTCWKMLGGTLPSSEFNEWDLTDTRRSIIQKFNDRADYRMGDTSFRDSAYGVADFMPNTEEETLFSALERKEAIDLFLQNGDDCRRLIVTWLVDQNGKPLKNGLRTIVGLNETHELLISSKTSAALIDYVTNRLRQFDSK